MYQVCREKFETPRLLNMRQNKIPEDATARLTFSVSRSLTVGSGVLVDILTRLDLQSASPCPSVCLIAAPRSEGRAQSSYPTDHGGDQLRLRSKGELSAQHTPEDAATPR